ncbi:MAG: hypothetical protein Q8940_18835 [Bacteroidota bacterium]|nr:hypothetical protein [Bacteroidota bacterium]
MKRNILFILILLSITGHSNAQWTWQNPLPQGNIMSGIFFSDTLHGWAYGIKGTFLRTTNGGEKWEPIKWKFNGSIISVYFLMLTRGGVQQNKIGPT